MKRMSIVALVCIFLYTSNTNALTTYQMDEVTAANLDAVSWSDNGQLFYIGYQPGDLGSKIDTTYSDSTYGAYMDYAVGFSGRLSIDPDLNDDSDPLDYYASVNIGLADAITNSNVTLTGDFGGFVLPISNDNQQVWEFKIYVETTGTDYISSSWTTINPGNQTTLGIDFGTSVDFSTVTDIGFVVQFNKLTTGYIAGVPVSQYNTSDDFHTSVVPVPSALLLTLIGLGSLRLKFRR